MNRIIRHLSLFAFLAAASCSVAELTPVVPGQDTAPEIIVTASIENGGFITTDDEAFIPETKTVRQTDNKVWWMPGDAISLFFGPNDIVGGNRFVSDAEEPVPVTSFKGTIGAATGGGEGTSLDDYSFWAVYPYNAANVCNGSSVTLPIPSEQASAKGNFGVGQWPTIGHSTGLLFSFNNIVAGYKFKVSTAGITKVVIRTPDTAHPLSGRINVGMDATGKPVINSVSEPSNEVVVTPEGGGTFVPGEYYYATVIHNYFDAGVSFDFYTEKTKATYECVMTGDKPECPSKRGAFKLMDNKDQGLSWIPTVGATVSIDFSKQGYSNAKDMTSVALDDFVTVTFDKGTNANTPKYYTTGESVRVYGGGTITVSAAGSPITAITLTYGSGDGSNKISVSAGTFSSSGWTGSEESVKFTVGGSSGHRRIQSITVTYGPESPGEEELGEPVVVTYEASSVGQSGATLSGSYAGASQTPGEVGFYWSTSAGVDNSDNELYVDMGSGASGSFSASLGSLSPSTIYYYRAYVMMGGEYFYGPEMSFTTSSATSGNQMSIGTSWLAHYEIPATDVPVTSGNVTYSTVRETYGNTNAYIFSTAVTTRRVVTHTFEYNSKTVCNYTLLFDKDLKCALWAAWEMDNADHPDKDVGRKNGWAYDPALPQDWQPDLSSSYSGYSRGHQVASNDRQTTDSQNKQTFYYSNMTPQLQTLNGAAWAQLEQKIQGLQTQLGSNKKVYVVTGPIFAEDYSTTTDDSGRQCPIPTKYYKCVLRLTFDTGGNITKSEGAGYWFNHTGDQSCHTVTIDEIEAMTGFDFYANVPDAYELSAESEITSF